MATLFPALLAGPIVRKVEPSQIVIWLATSNDFDIKGDLFKIVPNNRTTHYTKIKTESAKQTIPFGENLIFHLLKITPRKNLFPTEQLIGYNITFSNGTESFNLSDLGLLSHGNENSIVYDSLKYPSFYIPHKERASFLFGSCHKLHGDGEDTLIKGDDFLSENTTNLSHRPQALFLMGDQIYADDVAHPISRSIHYFCKELMGVNEDLTMIDQRLDNSSLHKINGRKKIMKQLAKFTSRNAANHLIEFGEYAAMYLMSWSPVLWEIADNEKLFISFDGLENDHLHLFSKSEKLRKIEKGRIQKRYEEQEKIIQKCRGDSYKIRRLFANIPTYMIFDDHDITDDWNINKEWKEEVNESPLGKHVISNGLSAYWAFQGWGNNPENFSEEFTTCMKNYFQSIQNGNMMEHHQTWIELLSKHQPWHFVAPTSPKTVFLDTRTLREYEDKPVTQPKDDSTFPPQLVNETEYEVISHQLQNSGWVYGSPLIIVSPTPVIGFDMIENLVAQFVIPLEMFGVNVETVFDVEAWRYNGKGLTNLLTRLTKWNPNPCIILSGDVHYGFSVNSTFTFPKNQQLKIKQITSSPQKNLSFNNMGIVVEIFSSIDQLLKQNPSIFRYCDSFYKIHQEEPKDIPNKKIRWVEQLSYDQVDGYSIIETENHIGLLVVTPNEISSSFLK
ncbi:hypothetical protein SAMN05880501_104145 [Ureibacillus xyleni]|uniref:PhoD-like phosphatase n=1 Tax=Ureibacillus xyleni TaxID=614648 RepID=A0A285SDM9_9BACL|nr:hypothetical protein [Ureibacillus xyleni]SOC05953.1 hypothetical protein SAMN05880501_104145 [Ureibacillus xyleni]